jgi:hypothetical protein
VTKSPGGLDALREKSLVMGEMVKNVWNGLGISRDAAA